MLNRESQAAALLPPVVTQPGVAISSRTPISSWPSISIRPTARSVPITLSNYAYLQLVYPLERLPGVSQVSIFGERRYAIRIWLDPDKMAKLGITATDVKNAVLEQNQQVAAGQVRRGAGAAGHDLPLPDHHARPARQCAAVRQHRGARRDHDQRCRVSARRGAYRARRADLHRKRLRGRVSGGDHGDLPAAFRQRARSRPERQSHAWRGLPSASRKAWPGGSATTPTCSSRPR